MFITLESHSTKIILDEILEFLIRIFEKKQQKNKNNNNNKKTNIGYT